jgi:hypothetical protein
MKLTPPPRQKLVDEEVRVQSLRTIENQMRTHVGIREKKCVSEAEKRSATDR